MEDEDVPPLEDMSELIQKMEALRELKGIKTTKVTDDKRNTDSATKQNSKLSSDASLNTPSSSQSSEQPLSSSSQSSSSTQKSNKTQNTGFGGFKKGFLFGGSSKKSSVKQQTTEKKQDSINKKTEQSENVPYVSAKPNQSSESLTLPEVQNVMSESESQIKDKADWVTNDLLEKIEKNKSLTQKLQDPKYVNVINEFQADPQAAMKKYQSSPDIQQFFKDFCAILGTHFENLADSQQNQSGDTNKTNPKIQEVHTMEPRGGADMSVMSSTNPCQPTADDERKMQEILSNPEIGNILMDPKIQNLFQMLKTDPQKGQRLMMNADDDMKMKIHRLVDCGFLQFQT